MKRIFCIGLTAAMVSSLPIPAAAQLTGGGKVIRIVVPFAPGGGRELLARAFVTEMSQAMGQTVIIENRPGAGGAIGTVAVAKSEPDGHSLILASPSHSVVALITTPPPYDPIKDFVGAAMIGLGGNVLIINGQLQAQNLAEFLKYVRSQPAGKLNYASAGMGSATHLSMSYMMGLTGTDMTHIPYKSTQDSMNDLIAGRVQSAFIPNINAMSFLKDPRVRLVGYSSARRSRLMPTVPTMDEAGAKGFDYEAWYALLAPAGSPRAMIERINSAIGKVIEDPVVVDRLLKQGIEPFAMKTADIDALLRSDLEKTGKIVKAAGDSIKQ
ncbi:MAG: tripartite tricarboxylate transporter substrate-binding protein [Burkholderiales bacterium]